MTGTKKALIAVVAVVAVVLAGTLWFERSRTAHVTAYFTNATGLYVGDSVKVRGVAIGTVESIEPAADRVLVEFSVKSDAPVGSDPGAVIVSPTLVSGRYVQLVGDGSGELASGHEIPLERTAVPVEYDDVKKQVTDLSTELGKEGFDSDGSLGRLVDSTASALDGNGESLKNSLKSVSAAMTTLSEGGPDLFTTVRNLQVLVSALASHDDQIRGFTSQLAGASTLLNDNRTQLDAALNAFLALLPKIQSYVAENRDALTGDVSRLNQLTGLLVQRQDDLAQILHTAPTALSDLYNIYDPSSNSLTGALATPDFPDATSLICALLTTVDAPQEECSRSSAVFGDLLGAAVRAAQGVPGSVLGALTGEVPAAAPAATGLPGLVVPGLAPQLQGGR